MSRVLFRLHLLQLHKENCRRVVFAPSQCFFTLQSKQLVYKNTETTLKFQTKLYSTTDNPKEINSNKEEDSDGDSIKQQILQNAMKYVHEFGWEYRALECGAEEAGYSTLAAGMFDNRESALVLHFIKECNKNLVSYLQEQHSNKTRELSTTDFIKNAVKHRLDMICPYIDKWPDAMTILLKPENLLESTKELTTMIDDIWYYAGDKSADMNYYTKRGLLLKVYLSTQAVLITDKSQDFQDTWEFLDRRFDDLKWLGSITKNVGQQIDMIGNAGFAAFTVLQNISGLNTYKR